MSLPPGPTPPLPSGTLLPRHCPHYVGVRLPTTPTAVGGFGPPSGPCLRGVGVLLGLDRCGTEPRRLEISTLSCRKTTKIGGSNTMTRPSESCEVISPTVPRTSSFPRWREVPPSVPRGGKEILGHIRTAPRLIPRVVFDLVSCPGPTSMEPVSVQTTPRLRRTETYPFHGHRGHTQESTRFP